MLTNAYLLAKIGADTAENEQHFAEILPKTGKRRTGSRGGLGSGAKRAVPAGSGELAAVHRWQHP